MKLVGKAYCWRKNNHIDYRCWFVLKDLFCVLYASRFLYSSEKGYKEPEAAYESEPESEVIDEPDVSSPCRV